ncbi:unnamed protein product [Owenia fusiformis]|uniref:Uncharacterized protein n=1 Tax=Owenia fusiformis TaxID=6347 RepID=A0A8J1XWV4_OWEFU|nr:unnamed protein product [Owenia fusiformis]
MDTTQTIFVNFSPIIKSNLTTGMEIGQYFANSAHTAIGIYLTLIAILGIVGNTLVIVTFWYNRTILLPTYSFILALAIVDLGMCILGNPFPAASSLSHRWIFGKAGCDWNGFLTFFTGLFGMYILMMISIDRFIIIVKAPEERISHKCALILVVFCGSVSLIFATMPLLGWSSYTLEGANTSCSVNWQGRSMGDTSYVIVTLMICFVIPVGVMMYSYLRIFFHVRRTTRGFSFRRTKMRSVNMKKTLAMEMKIAFMIGIMMGAFILSWSPYAIVSLWAAIGDSTSIPPLATVLPAVLAKSAIVWNPIIYVVMNKKFRAAMVKLLPCSCLRQKKAPVTEVNMFGHEAEKHDIDGIELS